MKALGEKVRAALAQRPSLALLLALAITLYGGLLRLDAFVAKYGVLDRPTWARFATETVAPAVPAIRSSRLGWARVPNPYVGGDPINYIKYGREMTSFYQPHVREPVFLALTRAGLWALDDQDAGVSLASAFGSTLAIFATYLVGAALLSPLVGLLAALLTAIEFDIVTWAPDGWRDDTFMATVLLAAWALLRLRARPSLGNAALAGLLGGIACLTRITALSFVLPALAWIVLERTGTSRAGQAKTAGAALLVLTVVVAPYLVSCAIATGDPFLAINYHTTYYRHAEQQPIDEPMSAGEYVRGKFASRPVQSLDSAYTGLFVQPFTTKWDGFGQWVRGLDRPLQVLAVSGLAAMPFFAAGRLLLVMLLASLVPYMLTWNVGGGDAWRFTMHAYPFYLVAAAVSLVGIARVVHIVAGRRAMFTRAATVRIAWRVALVVAVGAVGALVYIQLPWYVIREAIARRESTSVQTGSRDAVFYRSGWTAPLTDNITVRVSRGDRSIVRFPLPEKRAYEIVLRIDPVTPSAPARVDVLFNKRWVARLPLSSNPERVGSYRLQVTEQDAHAGANELILIPAPTVAASAAGPRFASLDPAERIGVRLWYVRILP